MGLAGQDKQSYNICGLWDPADPALESLNVELPKEGEIFMTVAVDLVIRGIREPVRFLIETPVKIFPQNERFWYFNKRNLVQQFYLNSKEVIIIEMRIRISQWSLNRLVITILTLFNSDYIWGWIRSTLRSSEHRNVRRVGQESIESRSELGVFNSVAFNHKHRHFNAERRIRFRYNFNLINFNSTQFQTSTFQFTDGDEPMLSGTGEVSKDCSADELANWAEVLDTWQVNEQRPKLLIKLTKLGIPEALRAEVWQRLSNCDNSQEMMDKYRTLITKACTSIRFTIFIKLPLKF